MPRYRANRRPRFSKDMSSRCIRQVLPNLPHQRSNVKYLCSMHWLAEQECHTYMCQEGLVCLQACIRFMNFIPVHAVQA